MLTAIQQRLAALTDSNSRKLFRQVQDALALSALRKTGVPATPSAFVLPLSERPERNSRDCGPLLQRVLVSVGVVLVIDSKNAAAGQGQIDALNALRAQVRQSLFGWQPINAAEPLALGNGDLYAMHQGQLWWLDRYTTAIYQEASNG